jgi:hypothetical protein
LKTINKFTKPPGYLDENEVDMKEQKSDQVVPKNVDLITTPEEILPENPLSGFKNAENIFLEYSLKYIYLYMLIIFSLRYFFF